MPRVAWLWAAADRERYCLIAPDAGGLVSSAVELDRVYLQDRLPDFSQEGLRDRSGRSSAMENRPVTCGDTGRGGGI